MRHLGWPLGAPTTTTQGDIPEMLQIVQIRHPPFLNVFKDASF